MIVYAATDHLMCHSTISVLVGTHSSEKDVTQQFRVSTPLRNPGSLQPLFCLVGQGLLNTVVPFAYASAVAVLVLLALVVYIVSKRSLHFRSLCAPVNITLS